MKLIIGLGNPGKKYDQTRHNTGFMVMDALAKKLNVSIDTKKFDGLYTKFKYHGEDVILLKPQTYMNESGQSVSQVMKYFKVDSDDVMVVYDDMDMPTGKLRIRLKGSAGGHNGIKSLIAHMHTQEFKRIRVGIDKLKHYDTVDWVLGHFSIPEMQLLLPGIDKAVDAIICWIETDDINKVMNQYNG